MRLTIKLGLVYSLLIVGSAGADTVWNPAGNGIVPPATGNWSTAANWTAGVPVPVAPGEIKASFTVDNAAECVVTGVHSADQVVLNVNGSGSVLRIKNGGELTTGNNWSAVGYSKASNRMVVETGGVANFGSHLWIGFGSTANGTLDVEGGTVHVASQLGLGWNGGIGYLNISDGGVVYAAQFDGSRGVSGTSVIDIESGSLIINGDKSSEVQNYIATGKITGYGGNGTAVYDYNVSNPGKTTVSAMLGSINANWHVVSAQYSTNELIITPFDAPADFSIVADGVTDVTDEIQEALTLLANLGGGALFLPAGHYRVAGNLTVPAGVTLRGDWQQPVPGQPVEGTVLKAYAGRDDVNAAPFISLSNSSGIKGVSIWYPEQLPGDIHAYPPTIGTGGGATIENITLVNTYFGYTTFVNGTTARPFVRNVYGTPLKVGLEFDCLADIGRIETVHFSPDYWAGSGLVNAPTSGEHEAWLYNNGTGMIVRRIDWSYSCYVTIEGYHIGFALRPGRHDGKFSNGQSYGFNLINCQTGVFIEESAYAGYQFTRFDIDGADVGIHVAETAGEVTMFHTCDIDASTAAVYCEGTNARVMMMSCDIQSGGVVMDRGYLSVINSDFTSPTGDHVALAVDMLGATIQGNRFTGGARIVDNTDYPVEIDHTALVVDPLPPYDFKKPDRAYMPAKTNLFVVTEAPYNAAADGTTDDTGAFQAALAAAAANGGGTVFAPGGTYRLDGALTVPTGVELRGIFDIPNDTKTKGSLLNVHSGRGNANGTPFIQLAAGSGVKGFSFHYPDQIYDAGDSVNYGMVPYPYLLRGLGADVYIMNLSATIPYQLLDLATVRCDRHYVDYIFSTALKTGIHVGGGVVDGQIHNCQFNPSSYTHAGNYYDSIPTGTSDDIHQILWRDATPYLFGDMTNEVLHENFVFGGARGVHMVEENGRGPSGHSLGFGVDQCTIAMRIDAVDTAGLNPINSQIVTVNQTDGLYLETGPALTNAFTMFGCAGWGSHAMSARLNGGDVETQLFHLAPDAAVGQFYVLGNATYRNLGGDLRDFLPAGTPFLTIAASASAEFIGNIINTTEAQMPADADNVTARGNLRVGDPGSNIPPVTTTVWNPSGSNRWTDDANWTGGAAPLHQSQNLKVVFNVDGADPAMLNVDATIAQLVMGDNGTSNGNHLVLSSGADLLCGLNAENNVNWTGIGYNRPATLSIGTGALFRTAAHVIFAFDGEGESRVDIQGGEMIVATTLNLGNAAGTAWGAMTIDSGGTMRAGSLSYKNTASSGSNSVISVLNGTLELSGNQVGTINSLISAGRIVIPPEALYTLDYGSTTPGKTTLQVISSGYDFWAEGWGVDIGSATNDYDSDLASNLAEYALDGDPTNSLDRGVQPVLMRDAGGFDYIHLQRNDDTNLLYQVEACTNLVSGVWTDAVFSVTGTDVNGGGAFYDRVTKSVPTDVDEMFIRLRVSHTDAVP